MISSARKISALEYSSFNRELDDSRLSLALPIPLGMRPSPKLQTDQHDRHEERRRTWITSHPEDFQERERSKFLDRMVVRLKHKLLLIHLREVYWIQSKGNLLCLHLQNADYDCRRTMKDISMMLDPNCFLRVHRNAIVNLDYVVEFDFPRYGNAFVRLQNGKALPISRTGRGTLRSKLLSRADVSRNEDLTSESYL